MSFRLVPLIKGTAPIIAIHRPVLLIGRHIECDVRIEQTKISRRHCCVAMAYDRVLVRDLGSRNKIRVNGQVVDEARLEAGDELAIGPLVYRLELMDDRQPVPSVHPLPPNRHPRLRSPPSHFRQSPQPRSRRTGDLEESDLDLIPLGRSLRSPSRSTSPPRRISRRNDPESPAKSSNGQTVLRWRSV